MTPAAFPDRRAAGKRLLVVAPDGGIHHAARSALRDLLGPGDLLVANDAATIPASLRGRHERTGAEVEVRLAGRRSLRAEDVRAFTAVVFGEGDHRTRTEERPAPPELRTGDVLALGPLIATVTALLNHPRLVEVRFAGSPQGIWAGLAAHGAPIQYAHLEPELALWDVWTGVAAFPAAFEAPSAGFLLDWRLLADLRRRGVAFATLTHAAGLSSTGDPALDARLPLDEPYRIPATTVAAIRRAWEGDGRVIALGTTVTRALEHAASGPGGLRPGAGLADQRIGPHTLLWAVDGIVSGVHGLGDSHYDVLRAFAPAGVLARASTELEAGGYRSHEFGDAVMVLRRGREAVAVPLRSRRVRRSTRLPGSAHTGRARTA
ncbi:MAG: S-adenosylmethionine:tRNA ribosyltransferase-isomerase [Gemmatimonadota bacterium]